MLGRGNDSREERGGLTKFQKLSCLLGASLPRTSASKVSTSHTCSRTQSRRCRRRDPAGKRHAGQTQTSVVRKRGLGGSSSPPSRHTGGPKQGAGPAKGRLLNIGRSGNPSQQRTKLKPPSPAHRAPDSDCFSSGSGPSWHCEGAICDAQGQIRVGSVQDSRLTPARPSRLTT